VDANGVPIRVFVTAGTVHDSRKALELIEGIAAKGLIADRGYDANAIVDAALNVDMAVVIPPRKNRKVQREYDHEIYRRRHLIENAFAILKRWRGVATRYAKHSLSFLASLQIRCFAAWCGAY
jgi:transposase